MFICCKGAFWRTITLCSMADNNIKDMAEVIHLNMIEFGEMQQALENMRWLMGSKADASKLNCVFSTCDLILRLWSCWGRGKIPSALDSRPTGSSTTAAPDNCCSKLWNAIKEPVREGASKHTTEQCLWRERQWLSDPDFPLLNYIKYRYKTITWSVRQVPPFI